MVWMSRQCHGGLKKGAFKMTIKPVDMQVNIPKATEVAKSNSDRQNHGAMAQQGQTEATKRESELKNKRVNDKEALKDRIIEKKVDKNEKSHKEHQHKEHQEMEKRSTASEGSHAEHIIDIEI